MKPEASSTVGGTSPPARGADDREAALADLFHAMAEAPREHDFFAVLRHVESLRPDQPRIGAALRPSQEALRLGQDGELAFAPAALESFEPGARPAPRLGVRFLGLLGPQGPMPLHFTEYVRERLRSRGDATLARFLDVRDAVDGLGAVLDLLFKVREGILELIYLPGEFFDRRDGINLSRDGRYCAGADDE